MQKWEEYHPWPPKGGIRHLVHNHKEKNFTNCFKKAGGVILIDEDAFFEWVEEEDKKDKAAKKAKENND